MEKLRNEIKNKKMGSLYLFTGAEKYLMKSYEKAVVNAYLTGYNDMNLQILEGSKTMPEDIIEAAETIPFMSGAKIVIVRESALFKTGRKADSDKIAAYLNDFDPQTPGIILIFEEDEVDKRLTVFKAVKKNGQVAEFNPLNENQLNIWHKEIRDEAGVHMSSKDAAYLFRICDGDMDTIMRETEKLITYKDGTLTKDDIDTLCTKTLNARIFDLVDAAAKKDVNEAVAIYNELISLKETPVGILAMLSRQIRLMLKCALYKNKGVSEKEIVTKLGEKPYSIRMASVQSKGFNIETLKNAALDAVSCDRGIKTGVLNGNIAVEMFIILTIGKVFGNVVK
jgi:DNA polymerase-3 subunit delta